VLSDPYVKQPSRVLSDVWSWLSITCPRRNCFQDVSHVSLEGSCKGRCSELLHPATNSKSCGDVYLRSLFRCVGSKWFKHTFEKVLIDWIYGLCQNIVFLRFLLQIHTLCFSFSDTLDKTPRVLGRPCEMDM